MAALRHVLAAVDLSNRSPIALTKALSLALSYRARLTVAHASKSATDPSQRLALRARLDKLVGAEAAALLNTRLIVLAGEPARALADFSRKNDVDLIVVGRHHHGEWPRLFFESPGEVVTRDAPCSVLVATEAPSAAARAPRRPMSRILCAVDLNASSGATLALAASLAREIRASLTVLHVIEAWRWPELAPALDGDDGDVPPVGLRMVRIAKERLAALVSAHVPPGVETRVLVSFGVSSLEIARVATGLGATLVVVGAHSARLFGYTRLGSNARYLLNDPPCSILLARTSTAAREQVMEGVTGLDAGESRDQAGT